MTLLFSVANGDSMIFAAATPCGGKLRLLQNRFVISRERPSRNGAVRVFEGMRQKREKNMDDHGDNEMDF